MCDITEINQQVSHMISLQLKLPVIGPRFGIHVHCTSVYYDIIIYRFLFLCAGSLGCRGDQARCFSNLAFAFSQLGDEEEAAESFIHALQGFRDTGDISNGVLLSSF